MNGAILKQIVQFRKRTVVALALLLLVAIALQLFVSLYLRPHVEQQRAEWLQLREKEGRGAALQDRETLYRNGQADLTKFHEKIYPKSQFARFIGELYEMTARNDLELMSITYKPERAKGDKLLHYALTLSVSGTYPHLKRFIYDLGAGNSNMLVIDSIAIVATDSADSAVQLQLFITSWFKMEAQ